MNKKIINFLRFITLNLINLVTLNFNGFNVFNYNDFVKYKEKNIIYQRYTNLIKNLDYKSKFIVDIILYRVFKNSKFVFSYELSNGELKQLTKDLGYNHMITTNDLSFDYKYFENIYPGLSDYGTPIFKFHHGLALLTNEVNNYIFNKDCIDGGAYNFESAVVLGSNYLFKNIYSFEIEDKNFKKGISILKKYYSDVRNIHAIKKGLWSSDDFAILNGSGSASVYVKKIYKSKQKNKNLTSIDNFSNKRNLNIGFIKLDIEGSEYEAIKGAKNTIQKNLPILSICIYHTFKDFFEIKPLIEQYAPNEYNFYIRKLAAFYFQNETCLICIPKKSGIKLLDWNDIEIFG